MKKSFVALLKMEIERIDTTQTEKRHEKVIEGFNGTKAIIKGKDFLIFNSNDYLGLRHNKSILKAEEDASKRYGSGPGAVRFISGTMLVHKELEKTIAAFHGREDAMVFSSAFAVNMAVLHCIIKGQSKDSLVDANCLVISDELNHRSIIDGIRVAGVDKNHKLIFKHLDLHDLDTVLEQNKGKFKRVLVVTDGIFSMLGEFQDLKTMQAITAKHEDNFSEGIITVVDDSHGVGCFGHSGRGVEEECNAQCDLLIGTFGKGFGVDGGYVVGNKVVIDYLRESAATYIYSNPLSPGTAGAALASITLVSSNEGKALIHKLNDNISYFKREMKTAGFTFACNSKHPIQSVLIGDATKAKALTKALYETNILVTNINYPIIPRGKDEIRVQISAAHAKHDIDTFIEKATKIANDLEIM